VRPNRTSAARRLCSPARLAGARTADHPDVIATPHNLYAVAFVVGVAVHALAPQPIAPPQIAAPIGGALLVVGALLAVWGKRTMERAGTNVSPFLPAAKLCTTGPFRFSRNPLYLARTMLYVALALLMNTAWPIAALVPGILLVHYGVILREERYLSLRFGEAYGAYQALVRRWL
jgi:protein-S-isoprenylcysteine O-methyltransferase Ste14